MSDTSRDSRDSLERVARDTSALTNELQAEKTDEHGEATPTPDQMSEALGYPNTGAMHNRLDEVYAWLLNLAEDPSHDEIRVSKESVQRHKDIVTEMRHCLEWSAPRAARCGETNLVCRGIH